MAVLLSFGHGFSARALAPVLIDRGWEVIGTTRSEEKAEALRAQGVEPMLFGAPMEAALGRATHVLVSAAPDAEGDPVLRRYGPRLREMLRRGEWVGYLSTTGVYGDHGGDWVDEETPLTPSTARGKARVEAEAAWQALAAETGAALHIFRLAGIYGPGRGPFSKVRAGTARRIVKPGQVFSRIHVDDIAQALLASIDRPRAGAIYNLCDDDPAPPEDVIEEAARLLGVPVPEAEDFETAEMTPMARSFYAESKKVRNDRIKEELGVRLIHPDYRSGLAALLRQERGEMTPGTLAGT
ncbi:SDR family oxidoreductase [Jannaschia seohaensis]|uniref:Nucleoside-diphosphate-sugar epimerase n=1 Tax=Jannaschia seohaensis TaxID=475081 RepID=A0A2Y9AT54_9RHOB|nr:SDR family oxidoreductase [Jannaschia seohaensis]PWJ17497.1 nucleoside-diphosphate-sugar epimerase [Jannaschia seohaensis]SSA47601.1 Nucleoside-diphosphate-sugar epimerase [Jannaschia seohaensis]